MFCNKLLCCSYSLLNAQAVERETIKSLLALSWRVANCTLLSVEALFANISTLDKRNDRQSEVLGKSIVARVVSWHSHDSACTISSKYIF